MRLWDDLLPLVQRITADPQLVRALIVALQRPEVRPLIQRFREFMTYKDRFDIGSGQQLVGAFTTAPDRTQPDSGYNRSLFQRLLQVISDSNGAVECSKPGAQIKDPLLGVQRGSDRVELAGVDHRELAALAPRARLV